MTADITDDDMVRAIELLRAEKKENESKKRRKNEKMEELNRVYETLNIPKDEAIRIVTFHPAKTIIHQSNLDLVYSEGFIGTIKDESWYRLDKGGHGALEYSEDKWGCRALAGSKEHIHIYGKSHKTNTFYLNTIHVCPFCNRSSTNDYLLDNGDFNNYWHFGGSSKIPTNMATEPAKYKRCHECKNTSRKDYLNDSKPYNFHRNLTFGQKKRLDLYNEIYPEPIKFTKKYYAEKRVKKLLKVRPLSSSESTFFNMLLGASKIAGLSDK